MTDKVKEAINDVYSTLGLRLSEVVYQKTLTLSLQQSFSKAEREKSVPVVYLDHEITTLKADIVIDNTFIIELKAVLSNLSDEEKSQIKRYMKILNISHGIPVNLSKNLEIIDVEM